MHNSETEVHLYSGSVDKSRQEETANKVRARSSGRKYAGRETRQKGKKEQAKGKIQKRAGKNRK